MAALAELWLKPDTLEALLKVIKARQLKGIGITISIENNTNDYGQNVNSYVSQTKEERAAKKQRYYTGNGKVYWTDGQITVAERAAKDPVPASAKSEEFADDLPF